jgi:hypothetical protein
MISEGLSVFHNPAYIQDNRFNFTLSRWLYSTNFLALGATYDDYSIGVSYLNYGRIQGYDELGNISNAFTPYDFCAAFGRRFGPAGAALKVFVEQIADQALYGAALSIGFFLTRGKFSVGAKVDNLGKEFAEDTRIPSTLGLGLGFDLTPDVALIAEAKLPGPEVNSGISYTYKNINLLLGSSYLRSSGWGNADRISFEDFGFTAGLSIAIDDYTIGYSVVYGHLSIAHQFALTLSP